MLKFWNEHLHYTSFFFIIFFFNWMQNIKLNPGKPPFIIIYEIHMPLILGFKVSLSSPHNKTYDYKNNYKHKKSLKLQKNYSKLKRQHRFVHHRWWCLLCYCTSHLQPITSPFVSSVIII